VPVFLCLRVGLGEMTNIIFSPTLQAPIVLSNPTGSLALASDPSASIHQANPIPNQGAVALVGAAVRLSLAIATVSGAASVSGVTPGVIRGTVTHPAVVTGALAASGGAPIVATSISAPQLTYPRVMLIGDGGDQSYGCNAANSFTPWLTAAAGNTSQTFIQQVGAWDVWIGSGVNETGPTTDWTDSAARDRDNLARALLKQSTTYTVKLNNSRPTLYFPYHIMGQGETASGGGGYQQYITQVVDMDGWLFSLAGGAGTITPASDTGNLINYSAAYQAVIGNAQPGQSIVGSNYGTTSTGSPTGAQGIARTSGNYAAIKLLMRGYTGDSRFSFTLQMGSVNCAGVFLDDAFCALDGNGAVANSSLDGVTIAPGSQQGGGYPGLDTVQVVMAHGNHNFFDQMQIMVTTLGTGNFYNFANFGQYANNYQFGTAPLTAGWSNLNGGLIEAAIGDGAASWEYFQTAGVNPSGWPAVRTNYYQGMAFCVAPAWWNAATMGTYEPLVGLGTMLPATDGSSTASFAVNGTLTSVTAGTALEYQLMRYGLCTALLHNGLAAFGVSGYNYALTRWYDEFGDDSLTQVNVKRGYLGVPTSNPPTAATWAQGPLGVWSRTWTNGLSIVNPRGNGSQTVALSGTYQKLQGTQQSSINNGAYVTSVTLGDGDGIIVLGPKTAATLAITTTSLPAATVGAAYSATMAATGGFPPYAWSATITPNAGSQFSMSTGGVLSGTPGTAENESCVAKVTDAANNSATVTLGFSVATASSFAPNRPAGLTTLFDRTFAPADLLSGGAQDQYGLLWFVSSSGNQAKTPIIATPASLSSTIGETINAPPDGNPTALAVVYPASYPIGNTPFQLNWKNNNSLTYKQMYVCMWVCMPKGFSSNSNNIKLMGISQNGGANHIAMLSSNGSGTVSSSGSGKDYRGPWLSLQGTGSGDNYGGEGSVGGAVTQLSSTAFNPTGSNAVGWWTAMYNGSTAYALANKYNGWHLCEWLFTLETAGGAGNGVFQSWVDGVLINEWTNVNYGVSSGVNFDIWSFIPYYGGGGSPSPAIEYLLFSRMQVAGA